jgi:KDO2-lipid IV(A) lauroyltransferase
MARRTRGAAYRLIMGGIPILFVRFMACLPLSCARALGRLLGQVAFYGIPRIRRVGVANLDLAYGPKLTPLEKQRIVRRATENLGIVAAEFGHLPKLYEAGVDSRIRMEGTEHLDRTRGFVLIGGHFGNWEWMPAAIQTLGYDIAVVYRPLDDPALDRFIATRRAVGGVVPVPKAEAGRELLRRLREGWVVGILVDQSPRDNAVPIEFFGARTWATTAPVLLALRARVPIHASYMVREASGDYTLRFGPEILLQRTGDTRADLLENTQRCHAALEACIRLHPDHWLWFHRRWKSRPHLEEAWDLRMQREKR